MISNSIDVSELLTGQIRIKNKVKRYPFDKKAVFSPVFVLVLIVLTYSLLTSNSYASTNINNHFYQNNTNISNFYLSAEIDPYDISNPKENETIIAILNEPDGSSLLEDDKIALTLKSFFGYSYVQVDNVKIISPVLTSTFVS